MDKSALLSILIDHEGFRTKPYRDENGKLTIGIGHNLDDDGLSSDAIYFIADEDIEIILNQVSRFTWYEGLSNNRQMVVCDMVFNLGLDDFKKFERMIAAIQAGNFNEAANQIENSQYFKETGSRAIWARDNMRNG